MRLAQTPRAFDLAHGPKKTDQSEGRFAPGTVVVVDAKPFGLVEHVGIWTERDTVISCSWRRRGVAEETPEAFSRGLPIRARAFQGQVDAGEAIDRARSRVGARYRLLFHNCEHFVHWAYGVKPRSPQLRGAAANVAVVAVAAIVLRRPPWS